MNLPQLLTTEEAAAHMGISPETLKKARARREGPAFIKLGRNIRYSQQELLNYLQQQTIPTTKPTKI